MHTKLLAITLVAFLGFSSCAWAQSEGKKASQKASDNATGLSLPESGNVGSTLQPSNANSNSGSAVQSSQLQTPSPQQPVTTEPIIQPADIAKPE